MTVYSLAITLHRVFIAFNRDAIQAGPISNKADDMPIRQGFDSADLRP